MNPTEPNLDRFSQPMVFGEDAKPEPPEDDPLDEYNPEDEREEA